MKPEEIVVGQRYTHPYYFGNVWLGCGTRKLFTENEYVERHLVLITSSAANQIGRVFQPPENAMEGAWENFRPEGEGDVYIFTVAVVK